MLIVVPGRRINPVFFSILLLSQLFTALLAAAQSNNKVTGRVIHSETKEAVPFAGVFFANTTVGTETAADGTFALQGYPDGKYDLIVTHVGFENYQVAIDFTTTHVVEREVMLKEVAVKLKEVVVYGNSSNKEFLGYFKRYFIGTTRNSAKCEIINPESLFFDYDKQKKVLVVQADEPIIIENRALGYKVTYHLDMFEYRRDEGIVYAFGIPKFEALTPKNPGEQFKWEAKRKEAFEGSVSHFMRSLGKNQLIENGFDAKQILRVRNWRRPGQSLLDRKIKELRNSLPAQADSLNYYVHLNSLPVFVDSVGSSLSGYELFDTAVSARIVYKGKLEIVYKNEREEAAYVDQYGKYKRTNQHSTVHFLNDHLTLYSNGYYEDIKGVLVEGYWGWSEKISNLLPIDYALK